MEEKISRSMAQGRKPISEEDWITKHRPTIVEEVSGEAIQT
jgi:hypothetical protein